MHTLETYVYTVAAARGRIRRGAKSVLLFIPYTAQLKRYTKRTIKKAAGDFRRAVEANS